MTLQQLRYIVSIDRYRNFAKAAEALDITQPTLSSLLQKLEQELDVRIFERTNKRVVPTVIGEKIIRQAVNVISESDRITELVNEEKSKVAGKLDIAIGPTIAPYLLPQFIKIYTGLYQQVELSISEMKYDAMLDSLLQGRIDVGISISGHFREGIMEIQLYMEPFWVYIAESCWRKLPVFRPEHLEHEQMWIMKESQCLRESAFSFCKTRNLGKRIYEAGSIDTLVRIVDENGGFTIIPEMHIPMLSEKQRDNVRRIDGDYLSQRRVSLYLRHDFIREKILNSIIQSLAVFIPGDMLDAGLRNKALRL
ncbi:LysR substrate-binding domain-containing protein [Heminiphilus faecis]|uniref:LysR substrate-binding domain-containing protein n=1 Tax=Heminiphilus faecis TaxID=2601703 RepID=A0ABV4CRS4_9BACT